MNFLQGQTGARRADTKLRKMVLDNTLFPMPYGIYLS